MKNDINICPISKFIAWLILGLIVCLIGITNVFADTYSYNQFTAQLYDNYGPTLSAVTTDQTNGRWQGAIPTMTANSSGAAWGISSNMVLLANHTYTLTAQITGTYGGRLVLSTYNRIGVGTTLANAKSSYQNNTYVNENYSRVLDDGYTIQFAFTPTTNGSYIVFAFATTYSGSNQYFYLSNYTIEDLGSSGGVSESTINNSLNSQTNILNQSITNSQNAIIQNQNENAEQTQETIKDNLNTCRDSINLFNKNVLTGGWLSTQNVFFNEYTDTYGVSEYIPVEPSTTYTLNLYNSSNLGSAGIIEYNSNQGWVYSTAETSDIITFTTTEWTTYVRFTVRQDSKDKVQLQKGSSFTVYEQYGEICINKLDEQTNAINGLNDSINDDNVDSSSWSNFFNNFTTNTFGLTSIITAPLNLIQSLTSITCTDLQLPLPYLTNKYLTLPCMSSIYSQYFGTFFTLYQTITYGIIAYWVCVRIFNLVKDFKNPDHDEIEVVDL